ncbi:MAG: hypothetical protein ABI068_01425 [Ktedonobacterales bacterium]
MASDNQQGVDTLEPIAATDSAATVSIAALQEQLRQLEATNAAMRSILLIVAEGRTSWEASTGIETCRFCSLKRGGEYGYRSHHDETCIVTRARLLGF